MEDKQSGAMRENGTTSSPATASSPEKVNKNYPESCPQLLVIGEVDKRSASVAATSASAPLLMEKVPRRSPALLAVREKARSIIGIRIKKKVSRENCTECT